MKDVDKMMKDIEKILEGHVPLTKSINKLVTATRLCISSVSSDMYKAKSELDFLSDSGNISNDEFITINSLLKDIGEEFNNCRCLSRK